MAFSAVLASGQLREEEQFAAESVAQQFPESIQALCPGCDLILLTDVHLYVFYAIGSEFTVHETKFGGAVATKWTITHWTENRPQMCRFNIHHQVTVTFGVYNTLYSLENDMRVLSAKPCYTQHFMCLVISRTVNWKSMVHMCLQLLQIECPVYTASQCNAQPYIVLMGWQRGSVVTFSAPLHSEEQLPLCRPVSLPGQCWPLRTFNKHPVYVVYYVLQSSSASGALRRQKRWKKPSLLVTQDEKESEEANPFNEVVPSGHTSGASVHTSGASVHTSGASVHTSGASVHTSGASVHTSGASVHNASCAIVAEPPAPNSSLEEEEWVITIESEHTVTK